MPRRRRDPRIEFGERVRAARSDRFPSQEALAHAANMHPTYVSSIERGQRNVSLINIVKIAAALGVDPADLVAGLRPPAAS